MPTIFDNAINALTNRDELKALEAAKKVAQDALLKAESEAAMRVAAEERATKAEAELAQALSAKGAEADSMYTQLSDEPDPGSQSTDPGPRRCGADHGRAGRPGAKNTAEINDLKNALAEAAAAHLCRQAGRHAERDCQRGLWRLEKLARHL